MACTMCCALLLLGLVLILTPLLCGCTGGGFSVELIHRDSARSPFHDPSLTPHARRLAAVRRSYAGSGSPNPDGAVSEVVSGSFEYFMHVNIGTPGTRMLALLDFGSDLVSSQGVDSDDGPGEKRELDESSNRPTDRPIHACKPSQWLAGPDWTC
uniref:Uncharacterized protein n=1 Tax=Aegilops tauschii TaxID=37682 RepID=M8ATQ9_AEGTA